MGCTTSTIALVPHQHGKPTHQHGKPTNKQESTAAIPPPTTIDRVPISTPVNSCAGAPDTTSTPSDPVDTTAVQLDRVSRTEERRLSAGGGSDANIAITETGDGTMFRTMSGAQVSSISTARMVPMSDAILASHLDAMDASNTHKRRSTMVLSAERSVHTRSFAGKLGEMQDQGKDWNDIPLDFFVDEIIDDSRGSQVRSMLAHGVSRLTRGSRVMRAKTHS